MTEKLYQMPHTLNPILSVVVPLYNEAAGLNVFHKSLLTVITKTVGDNYEIVYCDDGSTDDTNKIVRAIAKSSPRVELISFSRNFGKESALAAGIAEANGQAILMIDGDGQHPVSLIPEFLSAWRSGSQVVVGVRTNNLNEGWFKRVGSKNFYRLFNRLSQQDLVPGSSDFRLIDREVQKAFLELHESDRMTRALIDWLGFERNFIEYQANARMHGIAGYNRRKLIQLATNSFVSLTSVPLYLFGYLGILITGVSLVSGLTIFVEQLLLNDPLGWKFTGTAMLSILLLFLVGVVLLSQGVLALYISHIHSQSRGRPLYVIDDKKSLRSRSE
ncbi:MAG: glycosyltransferase family 2 protein [Patescibacteria group bacterium]|nr:glycosyltransferase family 2 protein [Patescibacteria group bacterium]